MLLKWIRLQGRHNNQGMTLVEIVISLLIIMIVFVPLISSFTTASKVNQTAKNNLYASNLASNLMETVKVLGIDGFAPQFHTAPTNMAPGATNFIDETVDGFTTSVKTVDSKMYFDSARGTKPYIYKMSGVREGTGTYDASITFSSASYTTETPVAGSDKPNDYLYADLSAFNAESTLLINPLSGGTNYDDMAVQYFMQLNDSYYYDLWVDACEVVNRRNDILFREYETNYDAALAAGTPLPTRPTGEALPVQKTSLSSTDIKRSLYKTTTIEISKVNTSVSETKYRLNSYVNYTFDNLVVDSGGTCASSATRYLTRNFSGFCDDVLSNSLDNIFFMYKPLGENLDQPNLLTQEKVVINNQVPKSFDVYLVIQAPAATSIKAQLPVVTSGTSNALHLYSQATLNATGTSTVTTSNTAIEKDRLLKELSTDVGRIYDVTIDIYESGSGFTRKLKSLSSTITLE